VRNVSYAKGFLILMTLVLALICLNGQVEANQDSVYCHTGMGRLELAVSYHELGRNRLAIAIYHDEMGSGFGTIMDSTKFIVLQEFQSDDTCYTGLFTKELEDLIENQYVIIIAWDQKIDHGDRPFVEIKRAIIVLLNYSTKHS